MHQHLSEPVFHFNVIVLINKRNVWIVFQIFFLTVKQQLIIMFLFIQEKAESSAQKFKFFIMQHGTCKADVSAICHLQ